MRVGPLHPDQSSQVQATYPIDWPSAHPISESTKEWPQSVSPNSPSRIGAAPPTPATLASQQASVVQDPKLYRCQDATSWCNGSDGMWAFHCVRSPAHPSPPAIRMFWAPAFRTTVTSFCIPTAFQPSTVHPRNQHRHVTSW